jgi:hypothetical protein
MHKNDDNLNGALTGMALAAATHWARHEDDTQRRLRNVRLDAEEALDLIREMQGRGEVVRSRLPTVMDAQVGLAIASPQPAVASVVPSTAPLSRPDLAAQMETAVSDMAWPPEPGQYDERGMVRQAGEMTSLFLSLTYEEIRAFLQGLAQSRPPSREAKVQIFYAANALVAQLGGQRLTWQQYKDAWARLFLGVGGAGGPPSASDPHSDPARAPQILGPFGMNVQSVVPLSSVSGAGSYANPSTDTAMSFRILASNAGNIGALTAIASIRFGTEFKYRAPDGSVQPLQPMVNASSRQSNLYADGITSTGFTLYNNNQIPAGTYYDVFITATAGVPTVG